MALAPFRDFLALIIFDGDFDLTQHLSADPAYRRTQLSGSFRGVEVEDIQEILVFKVVLRVKAASGHERIGDADGSGAAKSDAYVEIIIAIEKRIVNDGEDVTLVVIPIFIRKLGGDVFKLIGKSVCTVHVVTVFQHGGYCVLVFLAQLPEIRASSAFGSSRVRYIKHIAQPRSFAAVVDEGDALGAAPDISSHLLVPEVILRAGGGVRSLGVDHDLLGIRVLIQPCGGGKKARPAL
ncbi:hypothetical protein EAI89_20935 [Eubacterium sp. am_0171]|uniref:hypothetical protein n=1 Tax=unclassified Eubacterium (in: firmicutes) TaxID=2624479 RepID=UPI00101EB7C2|nr:MULTISPECIES: hypothetical protein [unclassified Eubacterium (in: firmicutes)]MSC86273.1 hypothetical protein [Eubacterium sp. BIOML-A1]MSD08607.1 hypothetical protein [Eubacterium sp. BIOML-A2]RYT11803.1 hypothetical protein EAI89_20935 [Eubacterium sp. am_0171]